MRACNDIYIYSIYSYILDIYMYTHTFTSRNDFMFILFISMFCNDFYYKPFIIYYIYWKNSKIQSLESSSRIDKIKLNYVTI